MAVSALTTTSAFSVPQVNLFTDVNMQLSDTKNTHFKSLSWQKGRLSYTITLALLKTLSHSVLPFVCSVQSYWTDWSTWGSCSATLCNDVGVQVRQRKCVSTQPMPLLLVPACQGHHSERRECSTPACTGENQKTYQHLNHDGSTGLHIKQDKHSSSHYSKDTQIQSNCCLLSYDIYYFSYCASSLKVYFKKGQTQM